MTDFENSVRVLTDGAGAGQDRISYDGFGNIATETNATFGDGYKFTGREWDATAQLQFNRARYYDPLIGKWISMDPYELGTPIWDIDNTTLLYLLFALCR